MTKSEIIAYMSKKGIDVSNKLRVRVVDHSESLLAPEKVCYKCYYTCIITGDRERFSLWPNTVGYQYF